MTIMRWAPVRNAHPDRWLVVEAFDAHSEGAHRVVDHFAALEVCPESGGAFVRYRELHRQSPQPRSASRARAGGGSGL